MRTDALFQRYYYSDPRFKSGYVRYHEMCGQLIPRGSDILEIGSGPTNSTSSYLSGLGNLTGVDISEEVLQNESLRSAHVYDGRALPFPSARFDACVSDYVLEHVEDPAAHFKEAGRVLRPGGIYLFRTPNLYHYVTLPSRLLPFWVHEMLANRLRGLDTGSHAPYPTYYRSNTGRAIRNHCAAAGLEIQRLDYIETDPYYGRAHEVLFYPMLAYERIVNSTAVLEQFRVNILGAVRKGVL